MITADEPKRLKINPISQLSSEDVPTLISDKHLRELQTVTVFDSERNLQVVEDKDPYIKIQEIDYSKKANGYTYTTEFFQSYIKYLKTAPIPGSRDGHHIDIYGRPGNDVYLIGGLIDEKNQRVYFKNYFPLIGETGTIEQQQAFIKAAKVNSVHFSLVAWTEDRPIRNEKGEIIGMEVIKALPKGLRNDAVEYGTGAMKQKTNQSEKIDEDIKKTKEVVYIMADEKYQEILKHLNNAFENSTLSKVDLARDLNIEIVTDKHRNALATREALEKLLGPDVEKEVQNMLTERENVKKENFLNIRERLMSEAFGAKGTEEKPNLKRDAAEPHVNTKICDEKTLKEQIEKTKEDPVVKMCAAQEADETSTFNDVSGITIKNKPDDKYSGVFIDG